MTATRLAVSLTAMALCLCLAAPAEAQPRAPVEYLHSIGFAIWPTSMTATGPGSWNTTFWILDYRLSSLAPQAPWGLHLQYATGGQSNWAGTFAGTSSGTDTIWSADVTYRVIADSTILYLFAGYGSLQWATNTQRVTSSGVRVGLETFVPFHSTPAGGNWSLHGTFAWYPSNSVTAVGTTTTGSGAARDWSVSIRYKAPPRTTGALIAEAGGLSLAPNGRPGPLGHDWAIEFGLFRDASFEGGSTFRWSGPFLMIQKTF